jgi:hypothetical protein
MMVRHLRKKHVVQEADRNRGPERQIVFAFVKLLRVQLRPIVQNALLVIRKGEHLHLDIEPPSGLIAGLNVENRELVVLGFLEIERVQKLNFLDFLPGWRRQDAVQHVD